MSDGTKAAWRCLQGADITIINGDGIRLIDGADILFMPIRDKEGDIIGFKACAMTDGEYEFDDANSIEVTFDDHEALFTLEFKQERGHVFALEVTVLFDPNTNTAAVSLALTGDDAIHYALDEANFTVKF